MKNVSRILRFLNCNITGRRNLFNESYLGLAQFKERKLRESSQSSAYKEKFKKLYENPNLKILSHDFKKFVYIINTEEDVEIFEKLFERYAISENPSEEKIVFQIFTIGPEIMRMYYVMNKPVEAFSCLKNPYTFSVVCDLKALLILQDLLYKNELYEEVCYVFNIIKEKQFYKRAFHFAPYVLYQAACYKMNTPQSYNSVMALYEKYITLDNKPKWPLLMYTSMFALKNCSLDIPLKYAVGEDPASINIKLAALIKSGDYSSALSFCNSLKSKSVIMKSVAEDLSQLLESVESSQDESLKEKKKRFQEEIGKANLIDKTLDELATIVMTSFKAPTNKNTL